MPGIQQVRVCLIGGGIAGASAAYHLSHFGWTDVLLLERDELTSGSTWHAAGNGGAWSGSRLITRLMRHSIDLYDRLEAETGQSVGAHRPGSITITSNPDRLDEFRRQVSVGKTLGLEFEILSPSACREKLPLMEVDDLVGGIWDPLHGYFDPSSVTQALAKGARARGAKLLRRTKVIALTQLPSGNWRVETDGQTYEAEQVVNCGGIWAAEIARLHGSSLPVVPMLHQYVVTEPVRALEEMPSEIPIIRDREGSFYLRQERDGLLVGPYEKDARVWNPYGIPPEFGQELLQSDLSRIEDGMLAAIARLPCLETAGIARVVHGPIAYTPDERPLIGPLPGVRNMWLCTGSAIGIIQGGGMGRLLAEWMVEGKTSWDPSACHPGRFGNYATKAYTIAKASESYAEHYSQVAYPGREAHAARCARVGALYEAQKADRAVFGTLNGWERPLWFAPDDVEPVDVLGFRRTPSFDVIGEEHMACREGVALFDMSTFGKYRLWGPNAEAAFRRLFTGRLPKPGRSIVTLMCSDRGQVLGDFAVSNLGTDGFYIVGSGNLEEIQAHWILSQLPEGAFLSRETTRLGVLHFAGPKARDLLADMVVDDVSNETFPFLSARRLDFGLCEALTIRVSFSGDLGYEVHVPVEFHRGLYQRLKERGQAHGLRLAGNRALSTLRLEKGFLFYGADVSPEVTPFEAGLGFMIDAKRSDFLGADVLREQAGQTPEHRLVLAEIAAKDADCMGGEPLFDGERVVGQVTSGGYGYWARTSLAILWLSAQAAETNGPLEVELFGERVQATILPRPPFDPDGARLRG